ncbi:MAG: radical SAM protein [Deltaproteobacteria bacterium]|nr:radical SAM protein [Deltaproteobacteria bacterium]
MRLTFVHCTNRAYADTQMFGIHFMPVWAYTLAAHLEALPDVQLVLFDDRFEARATIGEADLFLFTGINQDFEAIAQLGEELRLRFPRAKYAIGGPVCWSFQTAGKIERLARFDYVFVGDGEEALPEFILALKSGRPVPRIIAAPQRFDLSKALPMHRRLLAQTVHRYYGAIVEVSRGCPFLCEFCDIRVLPDNNRSHIKDPALIVSELDALWDLNVRQVLFACDNFIGSHGWAEDVCDAIHAWMQATGKRMSLYTWLTIDLSRHPRLLSKLRMAGFDMFFIGVESFNRSSLLETAKLQNTALGMAEAVRGIQSYGFIVVAGLIMGFDTDPDDITEVMLDGILRSGLISGDPSLLTALPGTPLYKRMQLSGRLRDAKLGLGGFKYQTNIKYLRPVDRIRADFKSFVRRFNQGAYQYSRLLAFYSCMEAPQYQPPRTSGYADLRRLLRLVFRNSRYLYLLVLRFAMLVRSPVRVFYILRAVILTLRKHSSQRPHWFYLKFWLFNWSNSILKYSSLSDADFDIDSVESNFNRENILPLGYEESSEEQVAASKVRAQRNATVKALKIFIGQGH